MILNSQRIFLYKSSLINIPLLQRKYQTIACTNRAVEGSRPAGTFRPALALASLVLAGQ